ncbi:hypothetical protein QBC37DRAFT_456706 [Rhypophila decipiens]|uniref:F-box domain-containing protein n=1 Tax=Rhypophila decipiens TaxID=261697 RepID=A0AAN6XUW3_9PEZI|nr:hypothetical protein QBC37DRAFT_456706 [Rhypophila decipiens]
MNFLDLIPDVKLPILDHLSQSDLPTLCLAHRRLDELARPVLYSCVELPSGFGRYQPHPIAPFLRTIISKPELSRRIRHLSFLEKPPPSGHLYGTGPEFQVSPSDMEGVVQFVEGCEVSYRDFWIEALQAGTMEAYLAVLLLNLPSIDYLRIEQGLLMETGFVGRVLRSYLCDTPPSLVLPPRYTGSLQGLRDICIDPRNPPPIRNTPNILPMFYLPSLKKLSIWIDDPADEFRWPTSNPPQALGLKSLKVQGLSEAQLGSLLSATPSLPSLAYTREFYVEPRSHSHRTRRHPGVLEPVIDLRALGISLAVVKDKLITLQIRTRDHSINRFLRGVAGLRFERPTTSLCLAEFHQLKVLEVPSEFIMGFPAMPVLEDNLPPNIEELAISNLNSPSFWDSEERIFDSSCEFPYVQVILQWLQGTKQHTPNIRKFSYLDHTDGY